MQKGKTIFNSERKRNEVFTPLNYFTKQRRLLQEGPLSRAEIRRGHSEMDDETMAECKLRAQTMRTMALNLVSEVQSVLQRTNGVISWQRLAQYVAGGEGKVQSANKDTIRKHIFNKGLLPHGYSDVAARQQ